MQFVRMATNAAIGGAFAAAYLTLLLLQLNPAVDLRSLGAAPLLLTWWSYYAVHAAAGFYVAIVLGQLLASQVRSPGWVSFRVLVWVGAGAAAAGAALMWINVVGFRAVLDPATATPMISAATVVSGCAALCALLAVTQLSLGRRARRLGAALFGLVMLASLAAPLALRGPGTISVLRSRRLDLGVGLAPRGTVPRVTMILLDGASLDFISPIAAEGRLPNFGRLLDGGAVMHLATIRPTHAVPVWTAVATGKLPYRNGVRSAASYTVRGADQAVELLPDFCFAQALVRFGFVSERTHTAAAIRARPLWSILDSLGITTGIVGWPLTYPATATLGYLVTDEFIRREEAVFAPLGEEAAPTVHPPELLDTARAARVQQGPRPSGRRFRRSGPGPSPATGDRRLRARSPSTRATSASPTPCSRPARHSSPRSGTPASTPSATTTSAMPSRGPSAT